MLCDARQATVKPQWHATISAHCSPFWGQLGVSQLLLLFLAGLTPLFSHLLTIGWSRLVFSGATEVTWFCSTCLSSFGRLAPACSHGNARGKRVRGITQAPWGKAGNWHIAFQLAKPSHLTKFRVKKWGIYFSFMEGIAKLGGKRSWYREGRKIGAIQAFSHVTVVLFKQVFWGLHLGFHLIILKFW